MAIVIETKLVDERSTVVVVATFRDAAGNLVTPTTVEWSLFDDDGNVVNSREDVSAVPAPTVSIVLYGDDLALADGDKRILTIQSTYSSTEGSDLPLNAEYVFFIEDFRGI